MKRAVFRFDASPEIGGGHAVRSLVLADALATRGWSCTLACRPGTFEVVPLPTGTRHAVLELDGPEAAEAEQLLRKLPQGCEVLVVDHFGRERSFEAACRGWARHVVAIDGQLRDHDCDLLLDPNPDREPSAWRGHVSPACRVLSGGEYALLRAAYRDHRAGSLLRRECPGLDRILVSYGAGESGDLLGRTLEGIVQADFAGEVVVLAGMAAPVVRRDWPFTLTVHRWVDEPAELLAGVDLLIGAGGATLWEACCLGVPALLVERAPNQARPIACVAGSGAAIALGRAAELTSGAVAGALRGLSAAPDRLVEISRQAAKFCDGGGSDRVATAIEALRAGIAREVAS